MSGQSRVAPQLLRRTCSQRASSSMEAPACHGPHCEKNLVAKQWLLSCEPCLAAPFRSASCHYVHFVHFTTTLTPNPMLGPM